MALNVGSPLVKKIAAASLVLAGTLLGLSLIEIALRIHPPDWLKLRMTGINLAPNAVEFGSDAGWSVERSDGKFVQFTPRTHFAMTALEYRYAANIDEWGGRVVTGNSGQGKPVVPFFGDSFVFGIGVDDQHTLVSLLHRGTDADYLNLGVPGSALPHHLDILQMREGELKSPTVCVFSFFTGNDFSDIRRYYRGAIDQKQSRLLDAIQSLVYHFHFLGKSYLVQFCKQLIINFETEKKEDDPRNRFWTIRVAGERHLSNEVIVFMKDSFRTEAEKCLQKPVERLLALEKELHFTPFFIVIPDKYQLDPDLLSTKLSTFDLDPSDFDPRLPSRIVDEVLERSGIPYYDLFDCLNGKEGQYYEYDDHFTPAGTETAAKCLSGPLNTFIQSHLADR